MRETGIVADRIPDVVMDAFKGVWPVTDKTMMKSLNGMWQL